MRKLTIIILLLFLINSCKQEKIEEIVVIGGGLMGSSVAWQLAKRDQKVLLIEQQDSIYSYGSSFGEARISRSLGPKNDIFSYLQQTSVAETKKLIEFLNRASRKADHSMEEIYRTSPVTYLYYQPQKNQVMALLDQQKDTVDYALNASIAFDKFNMVVPDSVLVIREFKQYSGTLNPKILLSKLHQGVREKENRIQFNARVVGLKREGDLYRIQIIHTKTGISTSLLAKKVVSSAGPYTEKLLRDVAPDFGQLINPQRLFLAFFNLDNQRFQTYTPEQKNRIRDYYPIAELDETIYYSMIEKYENELPVLKIGGHFLRTDIEDLDKVWEKELSEEEIEWSRNNTIRYFKMLDIPLTSSDLKFKNGYSCVYSLTSSEVPYVTNIMNEQEEKDPNFVVLGGMSGIGAKGALAYGLIGANLLLGIDNPSSMYEKTKQALGYERMLDDIEGIK
jgi:glycine/D-amino acid oxidase-like deaminating enzyme